ncbi:MAG: PPC domain-containing protein, partial [Verrucomicrobiota bacterium]
MNLPIFLPRAVRCIVFQLLLLVSLAASVRAQNIISNGAQTQGSISSGTQEDTWLFTGKAGDTVVGRVGTVGFTPRLRLFAPDNSLLMEAAPTSSLVRDAFVTNTLPADGTYRFTVSTVFPNQKGDYTLNLALGPGAFAPSPGDESGPISNGETKSGVLTIGDLDLWSFNANAGDSVVVRAGSTNFTPWILVIAPTGDIAAEVKPTSTLIRDSFVAFSATNSGVYTI